MEHDENYYLMMMDALDGELADPARNDLEAHLRACPDCQREWNALLAIEMLFRQAPMLSPAVGFATRTVARLPDRRVRAWALGAIYATLLLGGLIPLAFVGLLVLRYLPILQDPALLGHIWDSLANVARIFSTIGSALVAGTGRFLLEQPVLIGWMIILAGLVFLWGGVFQRLLVQPVTSGSRN
jgi:anti-sigma factor RsiW